MRDSHDEYFLDMNTTLPTDAELPPYEGVALADIVFVVSAETAAEARQALFAERILGFDTESKPTFNKGEQSTGPHLVQLATAKRVFLFPIDRTPDLGALKGLLESARILKVGFGLDSDLAQLRSRLGIEAQNVLDLSRELKGGKRNQALGAKTAVAKYFGQRLQKSRRITTSNWAQPRLTERQMMYAANDAQVALRVYHAARAPHSAPDAGEAVEPEGTGCHMGKADSRRLVARHEPLVRRIASGLMKGLPASVEADDLVQDGLIGLMDAIIRTSREKTGRQFEAYISQRVRGAMLDGLRANDGGTRRVRREMRRVEVAIQQVGHQRGRAPTEGEVAEALGMPIAKYQELLQEAHGYLLISLDDLRSEDENGNPLEQCTSTDGDPLAVLQRAAFRRALGGALDALPRQEQEVMKLYYEDELNMSAVGERIGLSEGRVSQIHAQAIARLRGVVVGADDQRSLLAPRRQAR